MSERNKPGRQTAKVEKTGRKPCDGCCERCRKVSDGVYLTPFFLRKQTEEEGK